MCSNRARITHPLRLCPSAAANHDGDPMVGRRRAPVCRPRPSARRRGWGAVALGQWLVQEQAAAGR